MGEKGTRASGSAPTQLLRPHRQVEPGVVEQREFDWGLRLL
jgi:hypothetical protein